MINTSRTRWIIRISRLRTAEFQNKTLLHFEYIQDNALDPLLISYNNEMRQLTSRTADSENLPG